MKKAWILFLLGLLITTQAAAQEVPSLRKKYINLGFSNLEMKQDGFPTLKSNFGGSFTVGRTYFVHKKPVAGMLRFGIDATWVDLNYTNYKIEYRYNEQQSYDYEYGDEEESNTASFHQAEIGVQVGPSVTLSPIAKLNVHTYLRYAPSFSALYANDAFRGGFASYFVGGGAVSYGVIGVGVEARFGSCKYSTFGGGDEDSEYEDEGSKNAPKSKFSGMRVYVSFRF